MRRRLSRIVRAVAVLAVPIVGATWQGAWGQGPMSSTGPAGAASAPAPATGASAASFDVTQLFATTCGWCHSAGGRAPGKGPQLMGTTLTDAEIVNRIKNGKAGAMPAFGTTFNDDQLKAIVAYIRNLKPQS